MMMNRRFFLLGSAAFLSACAQSKWAPDEAVMKAAYHDPGPPSITLITAINNRNGQGGHSALLINASQRVLFDPAGTWWHRTVPERNDVLYGITPTMWKFYTDYHARKTYHVVLQTKEVTPEVAEEARRLVEANGAVPKAHCAYATSGILRRLPGFESLPRTYFPHKLMAAFARLPGVKTEKIYQDDGDNNKALLAAQQNMPVGAN